MRILKEALSGVARSMEFFRDTTLRVLSRRSASQILTARYGALNCPRDHLDTSYDIDGSVIGNCVSRHITQGLAWGYDHRQATRLVDCRKTARSIVKRTRQHDADDAHASKRGQRVEKQIDSPVAVRLIGIRCHGAHGPGDQGQVVRRFADVDASRPKPLILIGNNHRHAAGSLQDLPKLADGGPSPVQDDHHHGIKTGPFVQKITQILKPFATRGANGNCPREMCLHPSTLCDTCPHSEREEKHLVCRRQLRPHSNNLRQICSSRCPEGIVERTVRLTLNRSIEG